MSRFMLVTGYVLMTFAVLSASVCALLPPVGADIAFVIGSAIDVVTASVIAQVLGLIRASE